MIIVYCDINIFNYYEIKRNWRNSIVFIWVRKYSEFIWHAIKDKKSFYLNKRMRFYHSFSSQIVFPGVKCQFVNITSMSANIAPVALYNYNNNDENNGIILNLVLVI